MKISRDCPLQSSRSSLRRVHSWRRPKLHLLRPCICLPSSFLAAVVDFVFFLSWHHLWFGPAFWWQPIELPLALSRRRLQPRLDVMFCACAPAASPYTPGSNASCVAAVALSALPASSTPAVPMAFRVRTLPLVNTSTSHVRLVPSDPVSQSCPV